MKRFIAMLLCAALTLSMTACSGQQASGADVTQEQPGSTNKDDMDALKPSAEEETTSGTNAEGGGNRILIAYFTWAENTVVENPEEIDADATTSASVLLPGNAAKIAGWIQERTGGELFSIVVEEPYSSDYDECLERAADEKAENARPELVYHVENMDDYDTVFLGFPNWWYTVPMAIHTFLEEYDFSGKTIVPFVTHGTGGLAGTIGDITADLPKDVTILDAIGVFRPEVDASEPDVKEWLDSLGFTERMSAEETVMETEKRITMVVDGQEITIVLNETSAANALYEMLPMELDFEDYKGIEKISYLPEELPTEGDSDSCDPDVGDFCLYKPWGNLSVFYEDFRESNGLVMLGYIESGMDIISGMDGDFTVTLKVAE